MSVRVLSEEEAAEMDRWLFEDAEPEDVALLYEDGSFEPAEEPSVHVDVICGGVH